MVKPDRIMAMASAFYESCILFTASDSGIFSKIAEIGPADAKTLAAALGLDQRGARMILDGCVAVDLLEKKGELYSNTPESALFLVKGSAGDLSGALRYNRDVYPAWGKLAEFVKTGRPVEKPETHLGDDPQRTQIFVMSMHYRALAMGRAVVGELDLTGRKHLLDVGGGPGTYSMLIAEKYPDIRCTVLELPEVATVADGLIKKQGLQNRVTTLPGDYRSTPFPRGVDVVNFFGVLHQESPESIVCLFEKAYEALTPGGCVYIMDMMTDSTHTRPKFSALFGVNMALTSENGWVFSDEELKTWLQAVGFVDCVVKSLPPPMPHSFASAKKRGDIR